MNFNQAIEKLKEGNKIRRNCWQKGNYWLFKNDGDAHRILVNSIGEVPEINKFQLESNDWEVLEDEKVESREINKDITNQIVGELIIKEKYKFLPNGLLGEIIRDVFEILKKEGKLK